MIKMGGVIQGEITWLVLNQLILKTRDSTFSFGV